MQAYRLEVGPVRGPNSISEGVYVNELPEFFEGRGLDLPYALAREPESIPDLLERVVAFIPQPEPPRQHLPLAWG